MARRKGMHKPRLFYAFNKNLMETQKALPYENHSLTPRQSVISARQTLDSINSIVHSFHGLFGNEPQIERIPRSWREGRY